MSKNKTYTADDVLAMCKEYMNETHIKFIEKAIYFATYAHKEQILEKLILCIPFK